ncbi:hypothetical protein [Niveibacterium sp. SC-1]|uniref:hypothetical protein n=1 Tax=Niveibacterium sp. SC-1 TaxID=3135646 RepID=UPI00311FE2EB
MLANPFLNSAAKAARANLVPGIFLQGLAAILLVLYFGVSSARPVFEWFATLKTEYGYLYSAIATALCGGLVPFAYLYFTGKLDRRIGAQLAFYLAFWAWKGMEVDALYRAQGVMFGTEPSFSVIASKVAVDQFIYSALWSSPTITVFYMWKNADFSWKKLRPQLTRTLFTHDIPTVVVACWLVWIPAVTLIYCLPMSLQVPMFNLVLCFWGLLLEVLNARRAD